ncbi:hypothetical protein QWZ02_19735 [Kinneretia asaccharophila]|uniref:hypothetical protein n=1 Tax=Roseateles asaccharophilus TaxID=582607 RepID=UPI00105B8EC6|nr:hypothetical protein [Roseateles asaccharophilus]MDN3546687.1 hypothetical protein [Roseateles asaccharophilus]
MAENPTDSEDQTYATWRTQLVRLITEQETRFRVGKSRWNFWYYGSMYGAVLFSATSALVLKLEMERLKGDWQTDAAALLATLAAILGTVSSTGNFERRWRTSRQAQATMQKLQVDLQSPNADLLLISNEYKRAIDEYQLGVVGNDA